MQSITMDLAVPQPQPMSPPQEELSQLQCQSFPWKRWRKSQRTSAMMLLSERAHMLESTLVCWKMEWNLRWRSLTPANSLIKNSLCRFCFHSFISDNIFSLSDVPIFTPISIAGFSCLKIEAWECSSTCWILCWREHPSSCLRVRNKGFIAWYPPWYGK